MKTLIKATALMSLTIAVPSPAAEKTLIDYFLPMPIQGKLVSDVWGAPGIFPRDPQNGLEDQTMKQWCYWDGQILKGPEGKYHLFASRWDQTKGHRGWGGSSAVHAVSDDITGPYVDKGLCWPDSQGGKGHNVTALVLPDGRYAVLVSETRPGDVFVSKSLDGPWEHLGSIKVENNEFAKFGRMSNVSVMVRPDGDFMIVARSGAIWLSKTGILGPYTVQGPSVYPKVAGLPLKDLEDPVVWHSGGLYHIVVNGWSTRKAWHITSKDGVNDWQLRGLAYDPTRDFLRYTDGTVNHWDKIERPGVVIENGHVTHFTFAVLDVPKDQERGNDTHGSKIIVVPFDGAALDRDLQSLPATARFSFGSEKPAAGATLVTPTTLYSPATGFGFEPGADITAQGGCVTCDQPFAFSVKLPEGNHSVTLTFGDDTAESTTTVKAEARRLMIENAATGTGTAMTRQITVNLRTPHIGGQGEVKLKQREKDSEMVTWDDKLTLEFTGTRPALRAVEIAPAPAAPTIFLAGDSTVCDQPVEPWNSWGQMLPRFFKPGVAVANYAQSGESIRSSLGAKRFEKIFSVMKRGDWLLVQFGHNDMKDRSPDALAVYSANLKKIVAETRKKGGIPVLITSMERKGGVNMPTLGGYPDAVRDVAREDKVALIDLHAMSVRLYQSLGNDLGLAFQDGTHHNNYGSYELAKCVATGIAAAKLDLAGFLVEEGKSFKPEHPDPFSKFKVPASQTHSTAKPDGN